MDTKIIRDEMNRLDEISGLDTSKMPVRISSRMTRCWGKCTCTKVRGKYQIKEIVFAARLLEHGTEEHILGVVRHEYAHAYVNVVHNKDCGHNATWKRAALRFGCNGKRCDSFEEVDDVENAIKYKVTCQGCEAVFKYRRASNIVKELQIEPDSERFFCRRCGSHKFVLETVSK